MASDRIIRNSGRVVARQIAEELGVSISTVSRSFSSDASVAPKTRAKVLEAAKLHGYQPDPFARTLITHKTRIASIFISEISNPFFIEALTMLTDALQSYGLTAMLFHVPSDKSPEEILPQALLYRPEYLIVMTATVSFQSAIAEIDTNSHLIFFNRYIPGSNTFSVTCDNYKGGRELAELLIKTGHRKMAYIAGTPDATTSIDRGVGFIDQCAEFGISVISNNDAKHFSYAEGYRGAEKLLSQHNDLDAIYCANDIMAIGAINAISYEIGLRVPQDISVVGFDDVEMASWPAHSLTTYRHPTRRMVYATMELIRDLDENPNITPIAKRIPGHLVLRNTHTNRKSGESGHGASPSLPKLQ